MLSDPFFVYFSVAIWRVVDPGPAVKGCFVSDPGWALLWCSLPTAVASEPHSSCLVPCLQDIASGISMLGQITLWLSSRMFWLQVSKPSPLCGSLSSSVTPLIVRVTAHWVRVDSGTLAPLSQM